MAMRKVHIVSHTHWDREWYRPFQLFRLKLVHLIDGVLDLLEHDPHFRYFMLDGQTIVLDDYLAMRPEKETVLRRHVEKGRLIIGPWHILPDMFLVGPEAHIRNLLQGDHTTRRFGRKMNIGYIPDPFGHPGQVPQILRGFGIETACLWRGLDDEPAEFWWQAPDGTRLLMAYIRDSYSNGAGFPASNPQAFSEAVAGERDKLSAHSQVSDYLVMFGTDHMEPPPGTSAAIDYADKHLPETRVLHSTLPAFVAALRTDIEKGHLELPVVNGELRSSKRSHLLPGVLSSRMWIKQRNTSSENLMLDWVEPFTTFASLVCGGNATLNRLQEPAELVRKTWHLLMENHPHDSICGCSIDQVHNEMKVRFDQVDQVGEELTRQSLETLAANTDTLIENAAAAIIIFNPNSTKRTDVVSASLELPPGIRSFDLVDAAGDPIPYQNSLGGSQPLINMTMDAKDFAAAFGMVGEDGTAAGMNILDAKVLHSGNDVYIDAVVSDTGEPNLTAWKESRMKVQEFLADPAITTYHVSGRSNASSSILFPAQDVPGNGFTTVWVRPLQAVNQPVRLNWLSKLLLPLANLPVARALASRKRYARPPWKIENEYFSLEADRSGMLAILDKRTRITYRGLNRFQDGADCGDEYNYSPPAQDQVFTPHLKHVRKFNGPVQQCLELELELIVPASLAPDRKTRSKKKVRIPITTMVSLNSGVPRVDIHTTVKNSALDHRLRVHFHAPFATDSAFYDGHFEVVERKIGVPTYDDTWIEQPRPEKPQRAFTDVSDGQNGLMIANLGLPEVEVLHNRDGGSEIALTLLRCVGWLSRDDFSTRKGHAGPAEATPEAQMQGQWSFDYSIIPHSAGWQVGCEQVYAFAAPLRAVSTPIHQGSLPSRTALIQVDPAGFRISAIKTAENGHGWLIRGYNLTGEELDVSLKPWRPFRKVERINLAEEKLSSLKPEKDGTVRFTVRGHEIVTVLFAD